MPYASHIRSTDCSTHDANKTTIEIAFSGDDLAKQFSTHLHPSSPLHLTARFLHTKHAKLDQTLIDLIMTPSCAWRVLGVTQSLLRLNFTWRLQFTDIFCDRCTYWRLSIFISIMKYRI